MAVAQSIKKTKKTFQYINIDKCLALKGCKGPQKKKFKSLESRHLSLIWNVRPFVLV